MKMTRVFDLPPLKQSADQVMNKGILPNKVRIYCTNLKGFFSSKQERKKQGHQT